MLSCDFSAYLVRLFQRVGVSFGKRNPILGRCPFLRSLWRTRRCSRQFFAGVLCSSYRYRVHDRAIDCVEPGKLSSGQVMQSHCALPSYTEAWHVCVWYKASSTSCSALARAVWFWKDCRARFGICHSCRNGSVKKDDQAAFLLMLRHNNWLSFSTHQKIIHKNDHGNWSGISNGTRDYSVKWSR